MPDASFSENLISAYLDGELSSEERAHVERILQQHPEYAELLEEFRLQSAALKQLPKLELDADFAARVMADERVRPPANKLPADPIVSVGATRERWVGAVAAIGALAATILVVLLLPFLNRAPTDLVAAKSSVQADQARAFPDEMAAAPGASDADDLAESAAAGAMMSKGDFNAAPAELVAEHGMKKSAETLGGEKALGEGFEESKEREADALPKGPGRRAMPGMKESKQQEMQQERLQANERLLDLEMSEAKRSSEQADEAEDRSEGAAELPLEKGLGLGEKALQKMARDTEESLQPLLVENRSEIYGLGDSGGPLRSVNVLRIELPGGQTERKRLFDLLDKHQVALPQTKPSDLQEEGAVDTTDIYYVLADKAQMTRFALDLTKSSAAVIAMYRMGEDNRQKIEQYLQAPTRQQLDESAQSLSQGEGVNQTQPAEQGEPFDRAQQLHFRRLNQQSIGVPMDPIIVKQGSVVAGAARNVREQLSLSQLSLPENFGDRLSSSAGGGGWFKDAGDSQNFGQQADQQQAQDVPAVAGGRGRNTNEAKGNELNAAKPGASQAVQDKMSAGQPGVPAAGNRPVEGSNDHAVQVYLLILQSRVTPDAQPGKPAVAGEKKTDQSPGSDK